MSPMDRAQREREAYDEQRVWERCHQTHMRFRHVFECPNTRRGDRLYDDLLRRAVPGKRVLDLFCANGAFSIEAGLAGAAEVVGVAFSPERVEVARFLADAVSGSVPCRFEFRKEDVYRLADAFDRPFDVVLAMGGLYHIADIPHVLSQIRSLTKERMLLQTSKVLQLPGNRAKFVVRRDRTAAGFSRTPAAAG